MQNPGFAIIDIIAYDNAYDIMTIIAIIRAIIAVIWHSVYY